MNAYDFVQLAMLAHGRTIKGKTKLQKTMYFLGVLSGHAKDLGFRPHYYGPFSPDVAEAIDDLRGLGFVDESVASVGSVDASGFEVARHDFSLNNDGKSVADAKARKQTRDYQKIREAVRKFAKVEQNDYERLSIAAKTYFMLGEKKGNARLGELATLAERFGWSVEPDQIEEAIKRILEPIGLVTLENK